MYRVFLGAPTRSFLLENNSEKGTYEWRTVSSLDAVESKSNTSSSSSFLIPHETYEAASFRISEFYQNTIFHDNGDDDDGLDHSHPDVAAAGNDQTTVITWPPTGPTNTTTAAEVSRNQFPSFLLRDDSSVRWDQVETLRSPPSSLSDSDYTRSRHITNGDASISSRSIAQFPSFDFNPNTLSSLSRLLITRTSKAPQKTLIHLLVAVLEVDPRSGTDTVKIKNGPDAGKEVAVLRMIVGDEDGRVAKLTAWRHVAEIWGGEEEGKERKGGGAVKRGDVVLIENVNGSKDAETSAPVLVASPYLDSKLTICYRTLPRDDGDERWRPDLRLGATDAAVRKVAGVVRWFEDMAGL